MICSLRRLTFACLLVLSCSGLAGAQGLKQNLHAGCPDLTGNWASGKYSAVSAQASGEVVELLGLSMVLEINSQHGCHFTGINRWSNGSIGGEERLIGVLNPNGLWITMIESNPHPEGGTSGRIFGRLTEDNHITWEYAAYADDGARANLFSTILSRGEVLVRQETCPDLTGTWHTRPTTMLEADGQDNVSLRRGPGAVLVVSQQHFCHLEGVVTWSDANIVHEERIAGVLHSDGKLITILGTGGHSDQSTRAYIHGSLVNLDTLHWDFVGISDDRERGQAFSATFTRNQAASHRDICPTVIGIWSSGQWEGLEATDEGTVGRIKRDFQTFHIEGQSECLIWGDMHYGAATGGDGSDGSDGSDGGGGGGGDDKGGHGELGVNGEGRDNHAGHSDRIIGVINPENGLLITRTISLHPSHGIEAIALHRLESNNHMVTEYTGELANGAGAFAYVLDLQRQ